MNNYRIGLDIGIASVGWAVLETNSNDEPIHIKNLGVRIFDKAEVPKTGDSLAAPRREARSARRRIRRRRHRLERIRRLLEKKGLIQIENFNQRYYSPNLPNVYQLRTEALERILSGEELAQILIHIAKHRGFKSNRKSELKDKDTGKVLSAIEDNKKLLQENSYRTVGEMIYKDSSFYSPMYGHDDSKHQLTARNKQDDYKHTIPRELLVNEVKIIFETQRNLGNTITSVELENDYLTLLLSQRSFDRGPGNPSPYAGNLIENMVGYCTFESEEKRASKATFTSEYVTLLEKLNHLTLIDNNGNGCFLNEDERRLILELAYKQKTVSYSSIRKKLNLSDNIHFKGLTYGREKNSTETEKTKFCALTYWHDIKPIFNLTTPC